MKKNKETLKKNKLHNTIAVKKGAAATLLTVVFIVAVVLINVLATVLCQRFPISLDFTSDKINTMSAENIGFIKSVDKDVDVYVLLTESQYTDGYMKYYSQRLYGVGSDDSNADTYFSQTVEFVKEYNQYNNKINVHFIDPTEPSSQTILSDYSNFQFNYGDILVGCAVTDENGDEVVRKAVVTFTDIYTIEDTTGYASYGYGSYYITANNIESKLSSAINKVVAGSTPLFAVLDDYSSTEYLSKLETTMTDNNFEIEHLSGFVESLPSDKYTGVILCAPVGDLSPEELKVIDEFLYNDGKRGKTFLYYANNEAVDFPNLSEFLQEWGIKASKGTLYCTNKNYYYQQNTQMFLYSAEDNEYTESADSKGLNYICDKMIPLSQVFETSDIRTCDIILSTPQSTTVKPIEANSDWTPDDKAVTATYPAAVVTREEDVYNNEYLTDSYVVAFASPDFVSNSLVSNTIIGNLNYNMDILNSVTGQSEAYSFVAKTISNSSYADQISDGTVTVVRWIFMAIIPILLIVSGVIIWIRRKNK